MCVPSPINFEHHNDYDEKTPLEMDVFVKQYRENTLQNKKPSPRIGFIILKVALNLLSVKSVQISEY